MAFMEKLRQNVFGVFGTIILFIILIVFLWGDASRGTNKLNRDAMIAGAINGEDISYAEFNKRVEQMTKQRRDANPEAEVDTRQIQEQVWEQLVNEKLIEQGAKRFGVDVSDNQLRDILLNDPPQQLKAWFTDSTGQFKQGEYLDFMTNMEGFFAARQIQGKQAEEIRSQILDVESAVRFQYSYMGLQSIVGSLYPSSPVIMQSKYELQNSKASGSFIFLNANLIPDSEVKVTDDEAKKYYEEHKGIFQHKATRSIRYAMLRMGPSAQDSAKVQTRFRRYTDEMARGTTPEAKDSIFGTLAAEFGTQLYTGTSYTPEHDIQPELKALLSDSAAQSIVGPVRIGGKLFYVNVMDKQDTGETWVKAQHILLRTMPGADSAAKDDSIKGVAEALAAKARSGADFAQLAKENSQDNSAETGGDVGWFSEKSPFVQEFKDAALPAGVGEIVGPVKTQFGYHIIKVTEKSRRNYKLRAINFDVLVSGATKNLLRRQAEDLRTRLEKGENFDTVAASMHLQVLDQSVDGPNRPIATSYALGQFAYSGDVGTVSNVIKMPDEALIVAQVSKVTPAGVAPFDEVKEQAMGIVRLRKKVDMLKGKADQIRGILTPTDSLSKARSIDSSVVVRDFVDQAKGSPFPDIGFDAALASALFKLKAGEISAPVRGQSGYFIVKATSVTVPNEAQFKQEKKDFQKQFLTQQRQAMLNQWLQDERDKATIERNWER